MNKYVAHDVLHILNHSLNLLSYHQVLHNIFIWISLVGDVLYKLLTSIGSALALRLHEHEDDQVHILLLYQ